MSRGHSTNYGDIVFDVARLTPTARSILADMHTRSGGTIATEQEGRGALVELSRAAFADASKGDPRDAAEGFPWRVKLRGRRGSRAAEVAHAMHTAEYSIPFIDRDAKPCVCHRAA